MGLTILIVSILNKDIVDEYEWMSESIPDESE